MVKVKKTKPANKPGNSGKANSGKRRRPNQSSSLIDLGGIFNDVISSLFSSGRNTAFIITAILVGIVVYFADTDWNELPIGAYCADDKHSKTKFCVFVNKYKTRLLGIICFIPNFIGSSKAAHSALVLLMIALAVFIPEATVLEYSIQSVALFLMIHAKLPASRYLILGLVIAAYYFGWLVHPITKKGLKI